MAKRGVAGGHTKMPTQREEVLQYMQQFGSISSFEAYEELGITQLGARIKELENLGFEILRNRRHKVSGRTGKVIRFVEYYLREVEAV